MRRIRGFGLFWWDFVVGDDWLAAAGVILAIAVTALLAHQGDVNPWWLMPIAIAALLWLSLRRATRP